MTALIHNSLDCPSWMNVLPLFLRQKEKEEEEERKTRLKWPLNGV